MRRLSPPILFVALVCAVLAVGMVSSGAHAGTWTSAKTYSGSSSGYDGYPMPLRGHNYATGGTWGTNGSNFSTTSTCRESGSATTTTSGTITVTFTYHPDNAQDAPTLNI